MRELFRKDRFAVQHRINVRDTVYFSLAAVFSVVGGALLIAFGERVDGFLNLFFAAVILVLSIAAGVYYFLAHEYRDAKSNRLILAFFLFAFSLLVFFLPNSPVVVCALWGIINVFHSANQIQETFRKRVLSFSAIGHVFSSFVGFFIGVVLLLELTDAVGHYSLVLGISLVFYGLTTAAALWEKVKYANYMLQYLDVVGNNIWKEAVGFLTVFNLKRAKNVRTIRQIRYDEEDKKLYLNLHFPKQTDGKKLHVVFYLHGGGWVTGLPENREGFTTNIAGAGYCVANMFYGLSPLYHHPMQIENVYKAIGWVIDHADEYNLDVSSVTFAGESAGAHLSAMVGAISSNAAYRESFNLDARSRDAKINLLILNCGVYDMQQAIDSDFKNIEFYVESYAGQAVDSLDEKTRKAISPINFVTPAFPPCFVITGEADKLSVCGFSLLKKLEENGVNYAHYHGKGRFAVHAFAVAQVLRISRNAMAGARQFLKENVPGNGCNAIGNE